MRISVARATRRCRSSVGTIGQLHVFEHQGFSRLQKLNWFLCREGNCKHENSGGFMRVWQQGEEIESQEGSHRAKILFSCINILKFQYTNSTFELTFWHVTMANVNFWQTILNVNCLQKDSEMNITLHKALLERFHLNGNTKGSYPQIQIFVFS